MIIFFVKRERFVFVFRLVISLKKGEFVFIFWNFVIFCGNLDILIVNLRIRVKRKVYLLFFRWRGLICVFLISLLIFGVNFCLDCFFVMNEVILFYLVIVFRGVLVNLFFNFLICFVIFKRLLYFYGFYWFVWVRLKVNCKLVILL